MMNKVTKVGICLLLISGAASALVVKMETPELTEKAREIVIGHVVDMQSRWNEDRDYIFTYVTVHVDEYVKGGGERSVTIKIPGGAIGDLQLRVSDIPEFAVGEKVVLFLTDEYPDYCDLLGLFQGKYTVVEGRVLERDIELEHFLNEIDFYLR